MLPCPGLLGLGSNRDSEPFQAPLPNHAPWSTTKSVLREEGLFKGSRGTMGSAVWGRELSVVGANGGLKSLDLTQMAHIREGGGSGKASGSSANQCRCLCHAESWPSAPVGEVATMNDRGSHLHPAEWHVDFFLFLLPGTAYRSCQDVKEGGLGIQPCNQIFNWKF